LNTGFKAVLSVPITWSARLVFQFFQLLPTLTISENAMLPMDFVEMIPVVERRPKALESLDWTGLFRRQELP
jgi:putative ABC transport system ATP-binding protein